MTTGPLFGNRERAESFGRIAAAYDRARPSYPPALVHALLMSDPSNVLDVGCGTGKAARLFAERDVSVLGVEIDPDMAAVARTHGIDVEVSGFEDWDDRGRRFDLLISAQAWHWVDPARGAVRAAQVLEPAGTIALFWNLDHLTDRDDEVMDAVYAREAPELLKFRRSRTGGRNGREEIVDALRTAGFHHVVEASFPWRRRYTRDEWLDLLPTYSDHHLLPDEQRARLLAGVGAAIDDLGGSITADYETVLVSGVAPG
ncbi:MAG: methyltransferase domain-containing protein [Jatrophihabitans sp.]